MMYLLKCMEDKSLCIIDDGDVLCDPETVRTGETIKFQYNKVQYEGIILMISDDQSLLQAKRKEIRDSEVNQSKQRTNTYVDRLPGKRQIKRKRYSSDAEALISINKKKKKKNKTGTTKKIINTKGTGKKKKIINTKVDEQIGKLIEESEKLTGKGVIISSSDISSEEESSSPSPKRKKEENVRRQEDIRALKEIKNRVGKVPTPSPHASPPENPGSSKSRETEMSDDDDENQNAEVPDKMNSPLNLINTGNDNDDDAILDDEDGNDSDDFEPQADSSYQLYGKDWDKDRMMLFNRKTGIYCIQNVFTPAVCSSKSVSSVARRLMEGIFNPQCILNCTLTGQAPRAQGRERLEKRYDCLHPVAVRAIIAYSKKIGKKANWPPQTDKEIMRGMTTKLRSIQKEYQKKIADGKIPA